MPCSMDTRVLDSRTCKPIDFKDFVPHPVFKLNAGGLVGSATSKVKLVPHGRLSHLRPIARLSAS